MLAELGLVPDMSDLDHIAKDCLQLFKYLEGFDCFAALLRGHIGCRKK